MLNMFCNSNLANVRKKKNELHCDEWPKTRRKSVFKNICACVSGLQLPVEAQEVIMLARVFFFFFVITYKTLAIKEIV